MVTPVITIAPEESAETAWARMESERVRHLIVTEGARLAGVISDRDLGGRGGTPLRRGKTVADLMTAQAATATPDMTLRKAASLMSGRLIGCLPVVEEDRVVGVVTATDVLDELARGSSRPAVRAQRQSMRVPPAGARTAQRKDTRKRVSRANSRAGKKRPAGEASPDADPTPTGRVTPERGRARVRRPDSARRAPFPRVLPRPEKREAGRTAAAETPAYIRSVDGALDSEDREYLRRKLGRRLGKFAPRIERTSVRVEDVNGPRGGIDKSCRIKVVLSGLPSIVVEERHHSLQAAMDRAITRTERSVRQAVQRRRARSLGR